MVIINIKERIAKWYKLGLWAVEKNVITEEEGKEIIGGHDE